MKISDIVIATSFIGLLVSFWNRNDLPRNIEFLDDVCVVWGDSAVSGLLHKIKFWNGIFTCNVRTTDSAAWQAFSMEQLSNNHLISDDESIRDQVKDIRVGDQIRVRGYLSSYSSAAGDQLLANFNVGIIRGIAIGPFCSLQATVSPVRGKLKKDLV